MRDIARAGFGLWCGVCGAWCGLAVSFLTNAAKENMLLCIAGGGVLGFIVFMVLTR